MEDLMGMVEETFPESEIVEEPNYDDMIVDDEIITADDLEDIPDEDNVVLPAARDIVLKIVDVRKVDLSDGALKKLNIQFEVVNGIVIDAETKFEGTKFWNNGGYFDNIFYYADPLVKNTDYYKEKKHLMNLKKLIKATGVDQFNPQDLDVFKGVEIIGSIVQVESERKNDDGEYVKSGEFTNCVRYFKPLV